MTPVERNCRSFQDQKRCWGNRVNMSIQVDPLSLRKNILSTPIHIEVSTKMMSPPEKQQQQQQQQQITFKLHTENCIHAARSTYELSNTNPALCTMKHWSQEAISQRLPRILSGTKQLVTTWLWPWKGTQKQSGRYYASGYGRDLWTVLLGTFNKGALLQVVWKRQNKQVCQAHCVVLFKL